MLHSIESVFVALGHFPLQRSRSDSKYALWNDENEERPDDTEFESQAPGYSAMISIRF